MTFELIKCFDKYNTIETICSTLRTKLLLKYLLKVLLNKNAYTENVFLKIFNIWYIIFILYYKIIVTNRTDAGEVQ